MATMHYTKMLDDIDGTEAEDTIFFSIADRRYAIDLSKKNLAEFEKVLTPYVKAARPQGRVPAKATSKKPKTTAAPNIDPTQAKAIREWAKDKERSELATLARQTGLHVADRGRLPLEALAAAFNASNPTKRTADPVGVVNFSSV